MRAMVQLLTVANMVSGDVREEVANRDAPEIKN